MDRVMDLLKQYRYGIAVLLVGLGLMLLPSSNQKETTESSALPDSAPGIQSQLEDILSQIEGAGKVKVLLSEAAGETVLYQQDQNQSGESNRRDTVVITDGTRAESGLITQVIPAKYQGAVIVCQGGDRPGVKLAIVEAVSGVTGLTSDKITVLKMK